MAVHLINIGQKQLRTIDGLVRTGCYESIEQFVEVAIRNQIVYEAQAAETGSAAFQGEHRQAIQREQSNLDITRVESKKRHAVKLDTRPTWRHVEIPITPFSDVKPTTRPLWGQFYRFLPLKLVARLLAQAQSEEPAQMKAFCDEVVAEARNLAHQLRLVNDMNAVKNEITFTTGFPNNKRDARKSADRFVSQYVGRVRSDGRLDGFLSALGFASLEQVNKERLIGLTASGLRFASLPNCVLDDGTVPPLLSDDEVSFLIKHIAQQMPGERDQLQEIIKLISESTNTPMQLDRALGDFYKTRYSAEKWTDAKVSVTRAGAVSRLTEMQLIRVTREGRRVIYGLEDVKQGNLSLFREEEGHT